MTFRKRIIEAAAGTAHPGFSSEYRGDDEYGQGGKTPCAPGKALPGEAAKPIIFFAKKENGKNQGCRCSSLTEGKPKLVCKTVFRKEVSRVHSFG